MVLFQMTGLSFFFSLKKKKKKSNDWSCVVLYQMTDRVFLFFVLSNDWSCVVLCQMTGLVWFFIRLLVLHGSSLLQVLSLFNTSTVVHCTVVVVVAACNTISITNIE